MNNAKPWIFSVSHNSGLAANAERQNIPTVSLALIQLSGADDPKAL
ncbi:hypothetical protein N0738_13220 [Pseudomonas aeruginosa]|nr:hypothetical protein [Pseudomonas aeruginosa]MCS9033737.1 hypothetical protein [Pseudomonas aeruginosa]MCS9046510.1 hypothetical protein [Pseudomonas aeruginosa]MCS9077277.1 hypothetical protein [Pseudomonas aeruginosa]MCS9108072.1 hypothetical protein [Pseudomonas aeruginosa]